eukprot:g53101.t1
MYPPVVPLAPGGSFPSGSPPGGSPPSGSPRSGSPPSGSPPSGSPPSGFPPNQPSSNFGPPTSGYGGQQSLTLYPQPDLPGPPASSH